MSIAMWILREPKMAERVQKWDDVGRVQTKKFQQKNRVDKVAEIDEMKCYVQKGRKLRIGPVGVGRR